MAEYRQWREENRTYLKDVVPLETPYNVKIEVSSLCNAHCIYCAHSTKEAGGVYQGNMSIDLFERILDDIKAFPQCVKLIELNMYGESLCNPNFGKMVGIANQKRASKSLNFTTNGLLMTPDRTDEIFENGGVDIIRISIQGLDSKAYWKTCGVKMDFEKFIDNLRYLYKHKGECQIRMKIADIALRDVPNGKEKFEELFGGIADRIFVEHIIPLYSGVDYGKIDQTIQDSYMNGREGVHTDSIHTVCHRPFYRMRVAADGKVTSACCDTPHDIVYGDIHDESLYDIWNGKKHRAFIKMQLEGRRFFHPSCKNCIAANDITTEADYLDPYAEKILMKVNNNE